MKNLWERAVVLSSGQFIKPDSVVIDCGANIGGVSQALAEYLSESGALIAIEANPDLIPQIESNLVSCSTKNIKIINKAAWSKSDMTMEFYVENSYYASGSSLLRSDDSSKAIKVKTISLDDLVLPVGKEVSLIKIDVEGAEYQVLAGATRIIREFLPAICFEVSSEESSSFNFLRNFGYRFYFSNSLEPTNFENLKLNPGIFNILAVHESSNFKPRLYDAVEIDSPFKIELGVGTYVAKVEITDNPNCLGSIGVRNLDTGEWEIYYESNLNHLKHFNNSTLLFDLFKKTEVQISTGHNCGHLHIARVSIHKSNLNLKTKAIKPKYVLLYKIKSKLYKIRSKGFRILKRYLSHSSND